MALLQDIDELSRLCRDETARYLRGEASNDRYCFELFRRAIVERDNAAWSAIYAQYTAIVRVWLHARMDDEEGVAAAFERFWRALDAAKFTGFGSLAAVLAYLKMCVHTAVVDRARTQRAAEANLTLDAARIVPAVDDVEATVAGNLDGATFWAMVRAALDDERERRVLYLSYAKDLTPREIHARHGADFPRIEEIYRLKRNALDRLRRSPALRAYVPGDDT